MCFHLVMESGQTFNEVQTYYLYIIVCNLGVGNKLENKLNKLLLLVEIKTVSNYLPLQFNELWKELITLGKYIECIV